MKKKKIYRVKTQYIFKGIFEVFANSKENARQKTLKDCGLVMGGSIHSTLPDEEINWAFDTHPKVKTIRITIQKRVNDRTQTGDTFAARSFLS